MKLSAKPNLFVDDDEGEGSGAFDGRLGDGSAIFEGSGDRGCEVVPGAAVAGGVPAGLDTEELCADKDK